MNNENNSYYECKRCFYKFYQKNHMKNHLNKKKIYNCINSEVQKKLNLFWGKFFFLIYWKFYKSCKKNSNFI